MSAARAQGSMRQIPRSQQTSEPIPIFPPSPRPIRVAVPTSAFASSDIALPSSGSRPATDPERSNLAGHVLPLQRARSIPLASLKSPLPEKPSDVSSHDEPDTPTRGRGTNAKVPKSSIGIGIETEFLVRARDPNPSDASAAVCGARMAQLHNLQVPSSYPRMHSLIGPNQEGVTGALFDAWRLVDDFSVATRSAPWGMEMTSPLFRVYKGSPWREEVRRTWAFLERNYEITTDVHCSTHVHISITRGFVLEDLKRIAQCIIHFEPAIEALVPPERRGNHYSKSNWLDNPVFASKDKSPREAIQEIGRAKTREEVVQLMTPGKDSYYTWNFQSLARLKTIEFRKGSPSRNAREALAWAEFTMTFILSAMQTEDPPRYLDRIAPNVDGLKRFLLQEKREPSMCDPEYLEPLWVGTTGKESVQPTVIGFFHGPHRKWLESKSVREKKRYLTSAKAEDASWMS